jgi:hypothetical protein
MLTAELLQQVFDDSFRGRTPHEVLTLIGFELPALDDHEEWESEVPMLTELEVVTNALAIYVAERCEGHPLSMFTTGLALGYLCANREVLEGVST